MPNIIDGFTRECLAIRIDRKLNSAAVIDVLTDLFILRGVPDHVRSDNDEGNARMSSSPRRCGTGSTRWERRRRSSNPAVHGTVEGRKTVRWTIFSRQGYCESFNSKLRDELLNGEISYSLAEARVIIEAWRVHYDTVRPHSSLVYRPPAPEAMHWPSRDGGSPPPQPAALAPRPVMHQDWNRTTRQGQAQSLSPIRGGVSRWSPFLRTSSEAFSDAIAVWKSGPASQRHD